MLGLKCPLVLLPCWVILDEVLEADTTIVHSPLDSYIVQSNNQEITTFNKSSKNNEKIIQSSCSLHYLYSPMSEHTIYNRSIFIILTQLVLIPDSR